MSGKKKYTAININEEATLRGIRTATVYQRLKRNPGLSVKEALDLTTRNRVSTIKPEVLDELYNWIVQYTKNHNGLTPSLTQICEGTGIKSVGGVRNRIDALIVQGRLAFKDHIEIVNGKFYDPEEAKALQDVLIYVRDHADDQAVKAMAEKLINPPPPVKTKVEFKKGARPAHRKIAA